MQFGYIRDRYGNKGNVFPSWSRGFDSPRSLFYGAKGKQVVPKMCEGTTASTRSFLPNSREGVETVGKGKKDF
jgi:hypothetical protein